jgi:pimeloyl-ACP methyl ester carboxylesterase
VWAREVVALAPAAGIEGAPYLVGHSQGGYVSLTTGWAHPDSVAGIAVIDSAVPVPPAHDVLDRGRTADIKPLRYYPTREAALERFRVIPADPYVLPFVIDHVAVESVIERPDGWTWKFDPDSNRLDRRLPVDLLSTLRCRFAVFRAEHGTITSERLAIMRASFGRRLPVVTLPGTGHHALLDDPVSLAVGLQALLECWEAESDG